jgi:hypothetical protein
MISRRVLVLIAASAFVAIVGCTPAQNAVVQSVRLASGLGNPSGEVPLDPKFQYLRVTRGKHVGWMWLGSAEGGTTSPVAVYYSTPGEVLRLQNGRVVGASGLTVEWQKVSVTSPSWRQAAESNTPSSVTRVRDVMPGYRVGVRDSLTLRVIPAPARSALRGVDPNSLTWFEERLQTRGLASRMLGSAESAWPPARYAVELADARETVVYAEQCLAPDLCFAWQRWSAAMQKAQVARDERRASTENPEGLK